MTKVFIALGSNIDAEKNLHLAAEKLQALWPDIEFASVYQSKAREVEDQDDFLNTVGSFETDETPKEIHKQLQSIEKELGKNPPFKFGPRTIDLDLLLYGDQTSNDPSLIIPHPRTHERRFVIEPLCELIDPQAKHPTSKKTWESLLEETLDQSCDWTEILL